MLENKKENYNYGIWKNFQSVFGSNFLLWFFPISLFPILVDNLFYSSELPFARLKFQKNKLTIKLLLYPGLRAFWNKLKGSRINSLKFVVKQICKPELVWDGAVAQ